MVLYDNKERLAENLNLNYINRSRIYLWPSIKLLKSYNSIVTQDIVSIGCGFETVEGLVLICTTNKYARLERFIDLLKENEEYIEDRIISSTLQGILIPILVNLDAFIKGYYSQIYTKEQIDICFKNPTKPGEIQASKVIKQDSSHFPLFFQQMKANFEVKGSQHIPPNLSKELFDSYEELDIPPCLNQELLFYKPN